MLPARYDDDDKYKKAAKKQYGSPVVMVVDNAPCHSNIEEVFS